MLSFRLARYLRWRLLQVSKFQYWLQIKHYRFSPLPLLKHHPAQPTLASVETPYAAGVDDIDDDMDLELLALRVEHAQLKSQFLKKPEAALKWASCKVGL